MVRANVWMKAEEIESGQFGTGQTKELYGLPHDHDFDFITVGYFGNGYLTHLYEYDNESIMGYVGESVKLDFIGEEMLNEGKVMSYRKNKDVHVQFPPESLSVSLNLLSLFPDDKDSYQYIFDVENQKIQEVFGQGVNSNMFWLDLAKTLADEESIDLVFDIAKSHVCPRTRAKAYKTLEDLGVDEQLIERYAKADKHPMVRERYARTKLLVGM